MANYCLDSNVISDILRGDPEVMRHFEAAKKNNDRLFIEDNDIYIAAISIVNGCTLVTANTRHFGRVEGLDFVNWREYD